MVREEKKSAWTWCAGIAYRYVFNNPRYPPVYSSDSINLSEKWLKAGTWTQERWKRVGKKNQRPCEKDGDGMTQQEIEREIFARRISP